MSPSINSFLLERAFKQLKIPHEYFHQIKLAADLGDVDGKGFPPELFQLSAPVIIRGLLNFSVLQMNRNWVYPFWVHCQLDPTSPSFVARSQNPLLINVTNRSWTALGSPNGFHEAIVDPRGLLTPLPREWSVDVWLVCEDDILFPSLSQAPQQKLDTQAPHLTTTFFWRDFRMVVENFVDSIRGGRDVVFSKVNVLNIGSEERTVSLCVCIRPFGPEGMAPIRTIDFKSHRIAWVDKSIGVVFAQEPDACLFGSAALGEVANVLRSNHQGPQAPASSGSHGAVRCERGLAHAAALFDLVLAPNAERSVSYSIALEDRGQLSRTPVKGTWRVSFDRRRKVQQASWSKQLSSGAQFRFGSEALQELFDANRLTLLQFNDGDFISPGPYLYHRFWFRDAVPMLRALDVLGFPQRAREVIDSFPSRLTSDGFFSAPAGEWDSNGAVLWTLEQHYKMTRSVLWLKEWYPLLLRTAAWISRMRRRTRDTSAEHRGLMPRSLSAEHLGTVDQYYWDSFWSLAGLKSLLNIARELGRHADVRKLDREIGGFEEDLLDSFLSVELRLGRKLIPSGPMRAFDESAIGSICSVYPLNLFDKSIDHPQNTVKAIVRAFVDDRGFFHPIIHSGYNPYLSLQLAHSLLILEDRERAWRIAESVFRQASQSYAYPEAIHPLTGGGSMGDGHHGWAAAEVVLFLRDCLLRESGRGLELLSCGAANLIAKRNGLEISNAPTYFGAVSFRLEFEARDRCQITFSPEYFSESSPSHIDLHLPWNVLKVSPASPRHVMALEKIENGSKLRLSPDATTLILQLSD